MNFKGLNVLVTGGGGVGVGAGVCNVLAKLGAKVIVNEKHIADAQAAAKQYPGAIGVAADVSSEEEVALMFKKIAAEAGVVHCLVNNAGIGLSKPAHQASTAEFNRLYDTDIKGVWQVSKGFVNQLLAAGKPGSIVNISSVHAHSTINNYAIYASCKSAVEGLTRGMAVELGPHKIRVNAIAPGYVHSDQNYDLIGTWTNDPKKWVDELITDQQVLHFDIQPDDCGQVVAFLLSDISRAVTGQTIYVDNGSVNLLYNMGFTGRKQDK